MKPWIDVYVGIGSNLHDPLQQVLTGIQALSAHPHLRHVQASPIYQSKPVGPQNQPDFINGVIYFQTRLGPHDVLDVLQHLEQAHGRVRKRHWGERTLDLDLLIYGTSEIHTPRLTVPHPLMQERGFVMYPLADLVPQLILNNGITAQESLIDLEFDMVLVKNGN